MKYFSSKILPLNMGKILKWKKIYTLETVCWEQWSMWLRDGFIPLKKLLMFHFFFFFFFFFQLPLLPLVFAWFMDRMGIDRQTLEWPGRPAVDNDSNTSINRLSTILKQFHRCHPVFFFPPSYIIRFVLICCCCCRRRRRRNRYSFKFF